MPPRKNPQPAVQPQPARGVKIVVSVAIGLLAVIALIIWGLVRAFRG